MGENLNIGNDKVKVNDSYLKILKVDKTSVFNCKVEMSDEIENSIFKNQYIKVANCILDIINTPKLFNEVDNIVSFTGEKGSGKTTILRSFINSLKNNKYGYLRNKEKIEAGMKSIDFEVLNIIDLKYREVGNSIVSIIVYYIYKSFIKKANLANYGLKKEVEDSFNRVFEQLDDTSAKANGKNIFGLNVGFMLKESISELIRLYLGYCKKDYLVIPMDNLSGLNDIDLVISDLKKYFNCEKVIILNTLDKRIMDEEIVTVDSMGAYSNIVYIEPIDIFSSKLEIDEMSLNNIPICKGENIFEQIRSILMEKFNYCICSKSAFKVLVGTNVKMIVDIIAFVNSLSYGLKDYEYKVLNYLEETVHKISLGGKQTSIIKDVLKVDIDELNKYVFINLSDLILKKKRKGIISEEIEESYEFISCNRFKVKKERVSIGDIITSIETFKMYKTTEADLNFIELLKCSYTVRLIMEFKKDSKKVISLIGKDYFGDYFKTICDIEKFNNLIEVGGKKSAEDLKHFFGFRKELFISILQPCYDYNNYYSRFIYDEINIFNEEDIYNQKYFIFKFLNILSYSLLNKCNDKNNYEVFLQIINIDYWINVLETLGMKLKTNKIEESNYYFETIKYLRDIIESNALFGSKGGLENYEEIDIKEIEGDSFIDNDDVEFLQNLNDELIKAQYLYSYNV